MKVTHASALAMMIAWFAVLAGTALWQFTTRGETEDIGPLAGWTALFAFPAWFGLVLPVLRLFPDALLLHDRRWSWLGWSLLGVGCYSVLVASWLGAEAFEIVWYPATMGLVAGLAFTWLTRSTSDSDAGDRG